MQVVIPGLSFRSLLILQAVGGACDCPANGDHLKKKITAVLTGLPFLLASGLFVLYLAFGYLAVNPLAQRLLPWVGEKVLASQLAAGEVKFDPLSLELTVTDLRLARRDGSALAGVSQLYVDLQADSLFRFAWHLRDIRISRPEANVEIGKTGQLNWAELLAALNKDSQPSSTMPRVVIDRLRIEEGRIRYAELNRPQTFQTALSPLSLELGHFSTLPEDRGDYLVAADLAGIGGKLRWKGNLGVNPLASAGAIDLQGVKLASLMPLLQQQALPLTLSGGELGVRLNYDFAMVAGKQAPLPQLRLQQLGVTLNGLQAALGPQTTVALQSLGTVIPAIGLRLEAQPQLQVAPFDVTAAGLSLKHADAPLLTLAKADVKQIALDAAKRHLAIGSVALTQGAVRGTRQKDGSLDWQQALAFGGPARSETKADSTADSKTNAKVNAKTNVKTEVPVDGQAEAKAATKLATNSATNSAASSAAKSVTKSVTKSAQHADSPPFQLTLAELRLDDWTLALEDRSFARPLRAAIGRIDAGLSVRVGGDGVRVGELSAELGSLSLQADGQRQPVATLARIALSGGELDLAGRSVSLAELSLSGFDSSVVRHADQTLNWQALLQPVSGASKPDAPSAAPTTPASGDWRVALDRLRLDKLNLHVEDKSLLQPMVVDVRDAALEARGLSLDARKRIAVTAAVPLRQGGRLDVRGQLSATPLKGDLQLKLAGLQLKPYSPYLSQFMMVNLTKGQAALNGRLSFSAAKAFSARFNGGFNVSELEIAKESDGTGFLSWDALSSDSLSVSLAPNRVQLNELRIVHPTARLIIYEDKTINLQRLLRTAATATPTSPSTAPTTTATAAVASAAAPVATPVAKQTSAAPSSAMAKAAANTNANAKAPPKADASRPADGGGEFAVAVERIRVSDADLEFADLSLRPQFGAHIHYLDGVINGLSTDAASVAQVELDGKVDDYGSARVRGSVQPFRATEFTDLKLEFRNLEMNRLTPYSGKFAGRKIDAGKLSVDLEYKLKKRQLVGENKVVINQIKLGERVDSRDAISLPLDLAIAILEDSNGVIDLDLPVTGSLDDPKFSYGAIIWKAIFNVIEKVVTAPFRAIGKLLGISAEQLEAISFDPGTASLLPPEQEKLKSVADALAKRPALTLQVVPAYDPAADKAALQELITRRDVAAELGMKLAPNEPVGPLDLANVKVQTAIGNLLKDRSGQKRSLKLVDSVKDYFRKTSPEDLPVYAAQLEKLKATAKVGDAELAALAAARGQAVRAYLLSAGKLDAARVSLGEPAKVSGDGKAVAMKMTLGAAGAR